MKAYTRFDEIQNVGYFGLSILDVRFANLVLFWRQLIVYEREDW